MDLATLEGATIYHPNEVGFYSGYGMLDQLDLMFKISAILLKPFVLLTTLLLIQYLILVQIANG